MNILERLGLRIRGNYCFYVIKPNTAVVVGVRRKKGAFCPIPKKIGRYTLRGIHEIHILPQYAPTMKQFTDKQKDAVRKRLDPFHQPVFDSLEQLPDTVEYVGYHMDVHGETKSVPSHIRYIDTLVLFNNTITLPSDLLYLGKIETSITDPLRSIYFTGAASGAHPHLPASSYLCTEVEPVSQIASGAFAHCKSLHLLHLSARLQRVGANLFWKKRITHNLPVDVPRIPSELRRVLMAVTDSI